MNELKTYIIRIIVVAAIVQLGVIVSGERYKKIYSLVGAIFIVFVILMIPSINLKEISFDDYKKIDFDEITISRQFTDNVSKKIKENIMVTFGIDANVNVTTDSSYSNICVTVACECSDELKYRIEEYVKKTFCTPSDEVIMISE